MATPWPAAVVLDLDGTLVDSAPDIMAAVNAAFAPLSPEPFDLATVRGLIGGGATVAVRRAAALRGVTLAPGDEAAALARFYPALEEASRAGRGLYPGAHEMLQALQARGIRLAIATNKVESATLVALQALGIARYFASIVGSRSGGPQKPDPAMLRLALDPLAVAPRDAVMVGDSHADVEAAKAAGMRVVAVSYGYSRTPVTELGADAVVDRLVDVPAAIARLIPPGA